MDGVYICPTNVAVIGAGVSGVAAAVHLKRAGIEVTVFERSSKAGGIWVYDEEVAKHAAYPSILPSIGDSPEFERYIPDASSRQDSPMRELTNENTKEKDEIGLTFAPPGPCYVALKNNVSTTEMEMTIHSWKPNTEEFVPHHVLAEYIQGAAAANGVMENIQLNTRATNVVKKGPQWCVETAALSETGPEKTVRRDTQLFDAVVVATGHYHAPNIPEMSGLGDWVKAFPDRIWHSKRYRRSDAFKGQNILLVGAGVSSVDIAKDLAGVAISVFQSSRGGMYDLPSHLLPDNAARVDGIRSFERLSANELNDDGSIPGVILLASGGRLCNIHQVILCTGYHVSFPFMRQYHADGVQPEDADVNVLVTNGQVTHNLHKDIWFIQDPSLAVVGVPYHTATFTLFEFQAMALAAVFSGTVPLPPEEVMRDEYRERVRRKGAGRTLHSLKGAGQEPAYVAELVAMADAHAQIERKMTGHSARWLEAFTRRRVRQEQLFSRARDAALDEAVMDRMTGC